MVIFISAGPIWFLITVLLALSVGKSTAEDDQVEEREAKVLPIFQVVKFPVSFPKTIIFNHITVTFFDWSSG